MQSEVIPELGDKKSYAGIPEADFVVSKPLKSSLL